MHEESPSCQDLDVGADHEQVVSEVTDGNTACDFDVLLDQQQDKVLDLSTVTESDNESYMSVVGREGKGKRGRDNSKSPVHVHKGKNK
jgi:hypothetical protein